MIQAKARQLGLLLLAAFVLYAIFRVPVAAAHETLAIGALVGEALESVRRFFDALLGV